jgi:hypothetical protein
MGDADMNYPALITVLVFGLFVLGCFMVEREKEKRIEEEFELFI